MADDTLSGAWIGTFGYQGISIPRVPMEIELEETGCFLTGSSREPNTFRPDAGTELFATFSGLRTGSAVSLTKVYAGFQQNEDPRYDGVISADFQRIDGVWFFSRAGLRGPFRLHRQPQLKATKKQEVDVTVD